MAWSSTAKSACDLLSDLPWPPPLLLGGGMGLRSVEEGGGLDIGVEDEWLAFGGVGGRGGGTTSASGSMSTSGSFPAASLSKILFLTASSSGGSGSGLFTSVGEEEGGDGPVAVKPTEERPSSPVERGLSFNSILINFPCLVAGGGGGFFLRELVRCGAGADWLRRSPRLSSSGSVSWDVRGVSCSVFEGSKIDCRDVDAVSAKLPVSPPGEGAGPWPVNSKRLKASTSIPAFAAGDAGSAEPCPPSLASLSISSNVF